MQAEEERRIEEEKQAVQAKKNAFLSRAAAFQQKKTASDEEVRNQVKQNSQKRNFGRKLNRLLKDDPNQNPLALELGLRGRAGNETRYGDEDYYDEDNEEADGITAQLNFKPPPPPPKKLVGMGAPPPPPPPPPKSGGSGLPPPPPPPPKKEPSPWYYVCENEPVPYYWNTATNETTMECPAEYDGQIYSATIYSVPKEEVTSEYTYENAPAQQMFWFQYVAEDSGEIYYQSNTEEATVIFEQPEGEVYIVCQNEETGQEDHWLEQFNEETGCNQYTHYSSGEVVMERPIGSLMIVQTVYAEE